MCFPGCRPQAKPGGECVNFENGKNHAEPATQQSLETSHLAISFIYEKELHEIYHQFTRQREPGFGPTALHPGTDISRPYQGLICFFSVPIVCPSGLHYGLYVSRSYRTLCCLTSN